MADLQVQWVLNHLRKALCSFDIPFDEIIVLRGVPEQRVIRDTIQEELRLKERKSAKQFAQTFCLTM